MRFLLTAFLLFVMLAYVEATCDFTKPNLANKCLCGVKGDSDKACASGCCMGAYCADASSCTIKNVLVSVTMITIILGLVAMCILGVRAQNAVNAKVLAKYNEDLLEHPRPSQSLLHKE